MVRTIVEFLIWVCVEKFVFDDARAEKRLLLVYPVQLFFFLFSTFLTRCLSNGYLRWHQILQPCWQEILRLELAITGRYSAKDFESRTFWNKQWLLQWPKRGSKMTFFICRFENFLWCHKPAALISVVPLKFEWSWQRKWWFSDILPQTILGDLIQINLINTPDFYHNKSVFS